MSESGWHLRGDGHQELHVGQNRTLEYRDLVEEARRGDLANLPRNAGDFDYLFVPGLFTSHWGDGYMRDNLEKMEKIELRAEKMELNTDVGVEENADAIAKMILNRADGRPVVLVAHSKGGLDAATAMAKHNLYHRVHAFVALQCPWGGTPFAEAADGGGLIEVLRKVASRLFDADKDAVLDLRYSARQKLMKKYPFDARRVPTICLSSVLGDESSMMKPLAKYLKKQHNVDSDGAVPELDAHYEGADYVKLHGLDHGGTVFHAGRKVTHRDEAKAHDPADASDDSPGDITYAMICLALRIAATEQRGTLQPSGNREPHREQKEKKKKKTKKKKGNDREKSDEDEEEDSQGSSGCSD